MGCRTIFHECTVDCWCTFQNSCNTRLVQSRQSFGIECLGFRGQSIGLFIGQGRLRDIETPPLERELQRTAETTGLTAENSAEGTSTLKSLGPSKLSFEASALRAHSPAFSREPWLVARRLQLRGAQFSVCRPGARAARLLNNFAAGRGQPLYAGLR